MTDCPNVLSLSRVCVEKGYSFTWSAGELPTLTDADGNTVTLNVDRYVPVLTAREVAGGDVVQETANVEPVATPEPTNNDVIQLFR